MKLHHPNPARRIVPANKAKLGRTILLSLSLITGGTLMARFYRSTRAAAHDSAPHAGLARLSEQVSVRAAGHGAPYVNLSDGREVLTSYAGDARAVTALQQNDATARALAAADFDEDGIPDPRLRLRERAGRHRHADARQR